MMVDRIRELLADQLDMDIEDITPDSDLMADLNADSLDLVEFVSNLEDEFGIMIPQDDVSGVRTVADVAELVESLQQ